MGERETASWPGQPTQTRHGWIGAREQEPENKRFDRGRALTRSCLDGSQGCVENFWVGVAQTIFEVGLGFSR